MSYWDTVPAGHRALLDLGWEGLKLLAPHLTDPATYAPLPSPRWTPTAEGKLPGADRDPRIEGVLEDAVNIGINFIPFGGSAVAGARSLPGLMGLIGRTAPRTPAETLASRSPMLYHPPVKPQRPFAADYPSGAPADAAGRLAADIEGRPLTARYVVGRRVVGGADEALPPAEYDAVTAGAIGSLPAAVAAGALPRGAVGAYRIVPGPERTERSIGVLRSLSPQSAEKVVAHEMGHMIEDLAGAPSLSGDLYRSIPVKLGMPSELKTVYNDLNNSYLAAARARNPDADPARVYWGTGVTPGKTFGYSKSDAPAEYMAEAIRAYLADPNYLKTVAPKTAAAIREAVNSHPTLSKVIQFNTLAGLAGAGTDPNALAPGSSPGVPRERAPVLAQ